MLILARATGAERQVALERTGVVRQRLWAQYAFDPSGAQFADLGNDEGVPLAYHRDVPTEAYVPIALATLGLVSVFIYRRLREPQTENVHGTNWPATAAIALGLVAVVAIAVAWLLPTEAESGVRRTIADVALLIVLAYVLAAGPALGIVGISRVRSSGGKIRAMAGFVIGFAGVAWFAGAMAACMVSDGCFH